MPSKNPELSENERPHYNPEIEVITPQNNSRVPKQGKEIRYLKNKI